MSSNPLAGPDYLPAIGALLVVGFVMQAAAPRVRASREMQKAWTEAQRATKDAQRALERSQRSQAQASADLSALARMTPEDALPRLRRAKASALVFIEDMRQVVVALETARARLTTLSRHRAFIQKVAPRFDAALVEVLEATKGVAEMKEALEALRTSEWLDDVERAIALALDEAADRVLSRSAKIAVAAPAPSWAECMASVDRLGAFAKANNLKLTG